MKLAGGSVLFCIVYGVYYVFGSIDFVPLRGNVPQSFLVPVFLCLVCFIVGSVSANLSSRATVSRDAEVLNRQVRRLVWHFMVGAGILGTGAAGSLFLQASGIPLLQGEQRLQQSGYITLLAYGLVLCGVVAGALAIFEHWITGWVVAVLCGAFLLLIGYRTSLLLVFATVFIFGWRYGRFRLGVRWFVAISIAFVSLSWLAVYRFGAGSDAYWQIFRNLGAPPWFEPFAPIWATPREGTAVLFMLTERVPQVYPFTNGSLSWSAVGTLAPGEQVGPRLAIAALVDGRPDVTITPSILGAPYVDFGWWGAAIFMLVLGFTLQWLHMWSSRCVTWGPALVNAYVLTLILLDIHAGLLDVSSFFSIAMLVFLAQSMESRQGRMDAKYVTSG